MLDFSESKKNELKEWLKSLELADGDLQKYIIAFTHPSYKGMVSDAEDYERYEFLGDAVIELIVAELLVENSQLLAGEMTEIRKRYVSNKALNQIYAELKIDKFIRTAMSYTPSIKDKADFVESFFGATFLDKGYDKCKKVWNHIQLKVNANNRPNTVESLTEKDLEIKEKLQNYYKELRLVPKNAKSLLQELCQMQNLEIPEYIVLSRSGPDHNPEFQVEVSAVLFSWDPANEYTAYGTGKTKKIAELKAAEALCEEIYLEYVPND